MTCKGFSFVTPNRVGVNANLGDNEEGVASVIFDRLDGGQDEIVCALMNEENLRELGQALTEMADAIKARQTKRDFKIDFMDGALWVDDTGENVLLGVENLDDGVTMGALAPLKEDDMRGLAAFLIKKANAIWGAK